MQKYFSFYNCTFFLFQGMKNFSSCLIFISEDVKKTRLSVAVKS